MIWKLNNHSNSDTTRRHVLYSLPQVTLVLPSTNGKQQQKKELKILLFQNSHRLRNTQNIPADRLPMPWLPSQGFDPSSQQVKEQMEKTILIWLGSFPLNPKSMETHWLHQGLGWVGCNYSKSLVLTLRDSLVSSNWSPGSCSISLSTTCFSHHIQTKRGISRASVAAEGWNCANGFSPIPQAQEKILPNYFPPQELRLRVFNGFCRAGCAASCVMLAMTIGLYHMLPGCACRLKAALCFIRCQLITPHNTPVRWGSKY